ncbi:hypothetical protein JIG36_17115 [Actinoplanes sp. LDG1-06]|uniref:Uncharacterized protein n=1 Tax=Paractinoplanes ovalisporus TaxID=2810368 RepID=A0ABS2ABT7_9ACTN|nr:hypothetical protein [Actinoplanes ovalisporus]MBM2617276.1 hypothetical protein [Actinoplanes ovalisporus]
MRKLWYAGAAIAGGVFLFAATPAQADLLPGTDAAAQQADERLADLLGQSNGLNVDNPLRSSTLGDSALGKTPITQLKAGQNSPDLNPLLPGEGDTPRRGLTPRESAGDERPQLLPDADVVRGSGRSLPVRSLPIFGSDGLPTLNGTMADGQTQNFWLPVMQNSSFNGRPLDPAALGRSSKTESFEGGVPLLGGLGGAQPANQGGDEPDISGLPLGGVMILPAASATAAPATSAVPVPDSAAGMPTAGTPAAGTPTAEMPAAGTPTAQTPIAGTPATGAPVAKPQKQKQKPAPTVTPDDPRLHEEPVDTDTTAEHRPFSADSRPIAGIDQQ